MQQCLWKNFEMLCVVPTKGQLRDIIGLQIGFVVSRPFGKHLWETQIPKLDNKLHNSSHKM